MTTEIFGQAYENLLDFKVDLIRVHWARRRLAVHHRMLVWASVRDVRELTKRPSKKLRKGTEESR